MNKEDIEEFSLALEHEEDEELPKYVILNGLPHHGTCYYLLIDTKRGQLVPQLVPSQFDIAHDTSAALAIGYSKSELYWSKKMLTPEMAAAVGLLTVTLERAIELTEKSRHDKMD